MDFRVFQEVIMYRLDMDVKSANKLLSHHSVQVGYIDRWFVRLSASLFQKTFVHDAQIKMQRTEPDIQE